MRNPKVDFVQDRFGAIWWTAVLIGLVVGLGAWAFRFQEKIKLKEQAQEQLVGLQQGQKQRQVDANKPLSTQQKKLLQLASEVNLDVNPIFAVVENVNVAGTLLKTMQIDKISGTLRLEFQMEDASKATLLSEALNVGNENRPWILERITTQNSPPNALMNSTSGVLQSPESRFKAQGSWSIRLDHL